MSASAPRETPAVEDTLKKRPSCCCCCYHYNKFDIAFAVFRYLEIALGVWTIALCVIKQVSTGDPDLFNLRRLANTSGPLIPLGVLSIVSGVLISGMGCCTKQAGVRFPLNRPRLGFSDRHFRREAKAGNLHLPGEFVVQGEGEEVVWWNGARWDQPQ
ncbi:hypothetical protein FPQ18DRAFT_305593 [Pyronema domesticum]|nr:hypothetical protein FPQ18DRAFT_305593 [Pyronema domesticum]